MAFTRQTLTLVSMFFLFFFALCCKATPSPTLTPSPSHYKTKTKTPTPTPTPAGGPDTDSSISLSELFELALPEIGVQMKAVNSGTQGSKVASKQLQAVERKINEFKSVLKKRLANPKTPKPIRTCLNQCQDNFKDAIDGVKTSIESIHKNDLPKANADVSAISTDVDTCNDCFLDMMNEDPEIKAFDDWVRGITGDCLINLQKT